MASLKSGTLVKLLEDLNVEENSPDHSKRVLLQIRSIVPVLEEGDLWPNKGFFLKVADSSHAMYVSLPQEHDEMILTNELQLGQLIYVQKLEEAQPVPILRGVTPLPGRHPCDGTPEDIGMAIDLVKMIGAVDTESIMDKTVVSEKKISELSDLESVTERTGRVAEKTRRMVRSLSASRTSPTIERRGLNCSSRRCDVAKRNPGVKGGLRRSKSVSIDNDSDSDSPKSSASLMTSKRRSWSQMEILKVKEIFDSSTIKHETKPLARSRSACVSPVRSVRYDSSDDNKNSTTRRRHRSLVPKSVNSSSKNKIPFPRKMSEETSYSAFMCSSVNDRKGSDSRISWELIPSNLVKLGKEVVRHRDAALLAAVEALQEASAADRLLKCLSSYSDFQLTGEDDSQPSVDELLNLQDDLAYTKLIVQSLTNITPLRMSDTDSNSTGSVKEALNLAIKRKKNATLWIKSALAFDLSPSSSSLKLFTTGDATNMVKKLSTASCGIKPKGACIVGKQRINVEFPIGLAADKDEKLEWVRGNSLCPAADLANALQEECQRWFIGFVEKFVDEVDCKATSMESESQIAGMMYQVKRVNDWLNVITGKEGGCKESCTLEESEMQACERVRGKIYKVLLKNVERTALAFDSANATVHR